MKTNPTPPAFGVRIGERVRICFDAVPDSKRVGLLVKAHMSRPLLVIAVSVKPPGVRLAGGVWRKSWVRWTAPPLHTQFGCP